MGYVAYLEFLSRADDQCVTFLFFLFQEIELFVIWKSRASLTPEGKRR